MEKFGKSQPIKRVEDVRFLTGNGRYIDDIAPDGALRTYVLRSSTAHAKITGLDVSEARTADGVHMVLIAQDFIDAGIDLSMDAICIKNRDGSDGVHPQRPFLATDRVRFVGEPIAMVVAETLQQARDAAELIELDYDDLPVHVGLEVGGPVIHEEAPLNRAFDYGLGDEEACAKAFAKAAHVVEMDVEDNRVIANSMEPRGAFAEWDGTRLHVSINGQGVWAPKKYLAETFKLDPEAVRVTTPDVGGGFGMKVMMYPEHYCVAFAAMTLGRPVHWMSDRSEAMLSDNAGRDLRHTAALAFDADYKIIGYRVHSVANMGAYISQFAQNIQTQLFSRVLTGVYDIQTTWLHVEGIFTNTTQVDAYRGAGRPEAIYLLERVMDRAARELGLDPWELRRKNFIPADAFPYDTPVGETYDVGDFHGLLARTAEFAELADYPARKAASQAKGKLRGQGLCYYIESILGAPNEDVKIEFTEEGGAKMYVGTQSNGQGHETVFAQFLSDQTGIPADRIEVIQGDSDAIANGGGTGGSRSVTVQSTVTLKAAQEMIAAYSAFFAEQSGIDADKVSFDDETFRAEGTNQTPTMLELAALARDAGRDELLTFSCTDTLPARSFPNGAHVAEVEIDPDTGVVTVDRYTVVDDFGNLINPMLAEGQVHGGVVQGIGQAITERVVFDEEGQLLSASFMDYAMPRADDVPMIRFDTAPVPSTANPLGMKGCGEAGTVGALAAVSNAMQDALWEHGIRQVDMPFTPQRVWEMLQSATPLAAE